MGSADKKRSFAKRSKLLINFPPIVGKETLLKSIQKSSPLGLLHSNKYCYKYLYVQHIETDENVSDSYNLGNDSLEIQFHSTSYTPMGTFDKKLSRNSNF